MRPILVLVILSIILLTGCPAGRHPNQISDFDGKTYDTLLLAHDTIAALRNPIQNEYPEYVSLWNRTNDSYRLAFGSYASWRDHPGGSQAQLGSWLIAVIGNITELEKVFIDKLPVAQEQREVIHSRVRTRRSIVSTPQALSLQDILQILEVTSEIAKDVPATSSYGALAELLIKTTADAVAAIQKNASLPIDFGRIAPIAPIHIQ